MADHLPPTAADSSSAAPMYSVRRIAENLVFIHEILAALEPAPDVGAALFGLLGGLGKSVDGDTRPVRSSCTDLLRGHPETSHKFAAFLDGVEIPAKGGPLARQRRSTRARTTPAAAPVLAPPPEAPGHGVAEARDFLERVEQDAGRLVYRKLFVDVLSAAKDNENMAADEIYDRAREALGPEHAGLLHEFATEYLPGEREWMDQQARGGLPRQRQRARAASSSYAAGMARAGDTPVSAAKSKKPRADEGNGHAMAVLQSKTVNSKRRNDDGSGRGRIGEKSSGATAAAQGRDRDDDYAPGSRAKRPHRGDGDFSGSAPVLGGHAYTDNKRPSRRAARAGPEPKRKRDNGGNHGEYRRFREEWELQARYSKLVSTMLRAAELLDTPALRAAAAADGHRSVEELFPDAECREFLVSHYGDGWGQRKEALERRGGEGRVRELERMRLSLAEEEDKMVDEEVDKWWREDPDRTAVRLHKLAMERMAADEESRRQDQDGGA